jgi:hypothetical protein
MKAKAKTQKLHPSLFYALAGATGIVPIPWIATNATRTVRRKLVTRVAEAHQITVEPEALRILSAPDSTEAAHGIASITLGLFARKYLRRWLPLMMLPPLRSSWNAFVLGHFLERQLSIKKSRKQPLRVAEAKRLRHAIDGATKHALSTDMSFEPLDSWKRVGDWLLRRLENSFDELYERGDQAPIHQDVRETASAAA